MSIASMMLLISLISKGIGVCQEIKDLADRIKAGEEITKEEIEATGELLEKEVDDFLS